MTQFDQIAEAMAKARWNRISDKCNGWAALCSLEREDLTNDAKITVRQVLAVLPSLGLGIVPLVPTEEMIEDGTRSVVLGASEDGSLVYPSAEESKDVYRAMIAGRPDIMGENDND